MRKSDLKAVVRLAMKSVTAVVRLKNIKAKVWIEKLVSSFMTKEWIRTKKKEEAII